MKRHIPILGLLGLLAMGCNESSRQVSEAEQEAATADSTNLQPALQSITAESLLAHTTTLSSDAFEGRAPGSVGEDSTVAYLTRHFKQLGLQPGNPDGTYVQNVPMFGYTPSPKATITANGKNIPLSFPNDYVALTRRYVESVDLNNSDMVFVGYGVVAPEYGWDDYKGLDVKGKTIVMLVNDPPVEDPQTPGQLDSTMFGGKAMTYYGRWTYKYEIAAEKGAAAAIIIHETGPAGYPYEVISGSHSREGVEIITPDKNMNRAEVEAWITEPKARELFTVLGNNFDALKEAAKKKDFKPVPLKATASFNIKNKLREVQSQNVIAKLEGSDPKLKDEYVIYTAHWDHLGKDPNLQGDQIYNGAQDNATGTAALLELAKAFSQMKTKPKRSILFLAVTAEEKGLLGSKYYASSNPLYPLAKTVAVINMDVLNAYGPTEDVVVVGFGNSTLEDVLAEEAKSQNRRIVPEANPEVGSFYRSDHFEFAKQGVPALYASSGVIARNQPADYVKKWKENYTTNDYHKPSDEVRDDWNLEGAVEDLQLFLRVGYRVANTEAFPEWKEGTEFKAKREETLSRAASSN
ncbi:M28 family metallopeptidase [Pontibacter chinhatensis]|uniref:Zn-dependent amino-or carboxypeptidase, M28 family n=1 Tax=Pontibacter chinhatensis TaxID=1436961 RepID=A0A1I2W1Y6_9BACT|nr:M28 family metallopeptidase [Pontibacter chinhatensis]SFG95414.1 Zn-dependent amino-or carboxypeptidase, M28 family [Pontibacter chinhatensis]